MNTLVTPTIYNQRGWNPQDFLDESFIGLVQNGSILMKLKHPETTSHKSFQVTDLTINCRLTQLKASRKHRTNKANRGALFKDFPD